MAKDLILLWILFLPSICFSQEISMLRGRILNKNSQEPVAFATLQIQGTTIGSIADENGNFQLPVTLQKSDSLVVSALGFELRVLPIPFSKPETLFEIFLKPQFYKLPESKIFGKSAADLVLEAAKRIPQNFQEEDKITPIFYRQTHRENGSYVRLIEARLQLFSPAYRNYKGMNLQEKLQISELRRSNVYERNAEQHGDHIIDLLMENVQRYSAQSILDPRTIGNFEITYDTSSYESKSESLIKVNFCSNQSSSEKIVYGNLWIEKQTYAIIEIQIERFHNPGYKSFGLINESDWKFQNGKLKIVFKKVAGKLQLEKMNWHYNHHIYNSELSRLDFVVEENFEVFSELCFSHIKETTSTEKFRKFGNLYSARYDYHPDFWENYSMTKKFPLSSEVKMDLEKWESLEEQFQKNGRR